jgi:inorganic phosphate transporter, PiT family
VGKSTLDKDLKKVVRIKDATQTLSRSLASRGMLIVFLIGAMIVAGLSISPGSFNHLVVIAVVVAAYMALNIGANDVANNMGPAVGSRVLTMGGAIAIAALCEATGAILAGGDVVNTVSKNLLDPDDGMPATHFILVMMAALLAAALWIHLATILGAPVSTTHSIVGGVVGAGVASSGVGVVNWSVIAAIAASWAISPVMGGLIAALLLGFIKWAIIYRDDRVAAARKWVPMLVALMTSIFLMYLLSKGLKRVWHPPVEIILMAGLAAFFLSLALAYPWIARRSVGLENRRKSIGTLFTVPLIFAVGLLSFAHGANDVANAVGPLAAIISAAQTGVADAGKVALPFWVLLIGAVGISLGLSLYGPRLIRTVGEKITKMDVIRAYCVALAAATTVLVASALGLPVSSTHIAVGAVFGVGYLREYITNTGVPNPAVSPRSVFLEPSSLNATPEQALKNTRKREKRLLVRRQHVFGIAAAWVITVPAAALVAALLYVSMLRFVS